MPLSSSLLGLLAIKATLILMAASVAGLLLRRSSGGSRHALWTATAFLLLALPLLESLLPRLRLEWLPVASTPAVVANHRPLEWIGADQPGSAVVDGSRVLVDQPPVEAAPRGAGFWLTIGWMIGLLGFGVPVLLGVYRSRRLMRTARRHNDARLRSAFARVHAEVGLTTPVALRLSPAVRTPMTGGITRPVVLLPEAALAWEDDCLDAVFRHELVHVRQRDALRQLAWRVSVAVYWFHPLAWRAAQQGALAREVACDEAVIRLGTRPSQYARHLLTLADPAPPELSPALVRLDHPHLEERVKSILQGVPVPASGRVHRSVVALISAWALLVAAATPTHARSPLEGNGWPVPDAALVLPTGGAEVAAAMLEAPSLPRRPAADCEFSGHELVRSASEGTGPVRVFTTVHEGIRICAAVRGSRSQQAAFPPRGRLPVGVLVTLATGGAEGTRRLEIVGGSEGNEHQWWVDGQSRSFDAAAAEWRDAVTGLVRLLTDREAEPEVATVPRVDSPAAMARVEAARDSVMQRLAEVRAATRNRMEEIAERESAPNTPEGERLLQSERHEALQRALAHTQQSEEVDIRRRVEAMTTALRAQERAVALLSEAVDTAATPSRVLEIRRLIESDAAGRQELSREVRRQVEQQQREMQQVVEAARLQADEARLQRRMVMDQILREEAVTGRRLATPAPPRPPVPIRERRDDDQLRAANARLRAAIRGTGS